MPRYSRSRPSKPRRIIFTPAIKEHRARIASYRVGGMGSAPFVEFFNLLIQPPPLPKTCPPSLRCRARGWRSRRPFPALARVEKPPRTGRQVALQFCVVKPFADRALSGIGALAQGFCEIPSCRRRQFGGQHVRLELHALLVQPHDVEQIPVLHPPGAADERQVLVDKYLLPGRHQPRAGIGQIAQAGHRAASHLEEHDGVVRVHLALPGHVDARSRASAVSRSLR